MFTHLADWLVSPSAGNLGSLIGGVATLLGLLFAIWKLSPKKVKISVMRDYDLGTHGNNYKLSFVIDVRRDMAWYNPRVIWIKDNERRELNLKDKESLPIEFPRCIQKGIYPFYAETTSYVRNTQIDGGFLDNDCQLGIIDGMEKYPVEIVGPKHFK